MTRPHSVEEFEQQYAERSGVTVEQLHSWGRFGEPCVCGEDGCKGFQMTNAWEDAIVEDGARARNLRDGWYDIPYSSIRHRKRGDAFLTPDAKCTCGQMTQHPCPRHAAVQ